MPATRAGATLLCFLLAVSSAARADDSAVDDARQVMAEEKFPWYDAGQDELKPVRVVQPAQVSNPQVQWRPSWGGMSLGQILVWGAIVVLLIAIAAAFIWAYVNRENLSAGEDTTADKGRVADRARIEALPFPMRRDRRDLLGEARRHYEEGNFAEAIIYLFSHELVEMDKRQIIRLVKGKTNRQYLSDIRRLPRLRRIIDQTMVAFEDVFFGNHPLDRARFEACWRAVPEFDQLLAERAGGAS